MAVLVEMISVILHAQAVKDKYPGGLPALERDPPNFTLCSDGELVRVGFMSPRDTEIFIQDLEKHGFIYQQDGDAADLVVVDQLQGPLLPCSWVEFGYVEFNGDPPRRITACRAAGSPNQNFHVPDGWRHVKLLEVSYLFKKQGTV